MLFVRTLLVLSAFAFAACERKAASTLHEQRHTFAKSDEGRVTLRFRPTVEEGLALEFRFTKPAIRVTLGQPIVAWATLTNLDKDSVTIDFTKDVTPTTMASHIRVSDCFCTATLTLAPKQALDVQLKVEVLEDIHLAEDIFHVNFLAKKANKSASDAH